MGDVRDGDGDTPRKQPPTISISSDSDEFHISTPSKINKKKTPRVSKKLKQAAEQARREAYANDLFAELNRDVFEGGLPSDIKLNWNKRLLTTAGKAKWHRSRDGVTTTEIELAMKILDCDERIRNTLSHEMCHLACWVINAQPKEGHGSIWKGWAAKVMRKRPDIEVTTKHNYEISYPFEWKCEKCAMIYGRFSKSIRPAECVCGVCKVGKLIPQFSVAQRAPRTPKTKADSRMAADKAHDSPQRLPGSFPAETIAATPTRIPGPAEGRIIYTIHDSDSDADSDSDVEILATAFRGVKIDVNGR